MMRQVLGLLCAVLGLSLPLYADRVTVANGSTLTGLLKLSLIHISEPTRPY